MRACIAVTALALAGCGGKDNGAPARAPSTYHIGKADLARIVPNDICQAQDAAFLRNLLLRVTAALPPGTQGFTFEDFDVRDLHGEAGKQAILRFSSAAADGHPQMMFAAGPFNPASCTVGPMTGGTGSGPDAADAMQTFQVPGKADA